MKIFIGCDDIASILSGLAEGFRAHGHHVTTFVFDKNKYYPEARYDICAVPPIRSRFNYPRYVPVKGLVSRLGSVDQRMLTSALRKQSERWIEDHDVFVFVWRPWLDEAELLYRIRDAMKKIICIHSGSDVRHIAAYRQEFDEEVSYWEHFFHEEDLGEKVRKLRLHETHADVIYSVPDQAGLAIRPYNHLYLPVPNAASIEFRFPGRQEPLMVHAPSRTGIKGTTLIQQAIDNLQNEGHKFKFEQIEGMVNSKLRERLMDADILVDELFLHGPGMLGAEAMLAGCAVVTRTLETHKEVFDPPVLEVTPATLYQQLKLLLSDLELRKTLAERGRKFATTHNTPSAVTGKMLQDLEGSTPHYFPTFYIERFMLPSPYMLNDELRNASSSVADKFYAGGKKSLERAKSLALI